MRELAAKGTIEFQHVSKRYRLGTLGTLRGAISSVLSRGDKPNHTPHVLWALRDVSFRVKQGESLGLIGPNGSGKTTTLKLLSNITRPTSGRIEVHGRLSCLIELGAGFHLELTGRENIFLNGAILGLNRHEIMRKLDEIVAFCELERFIDTPVKRYSSGMYVRLGFSIAAHVEPDILLVDEVLAVGDASFRHRCIRRMRELQRNGTTVLFVSHNMHLIRDMCDSALLLMHGQICAIGEPPTVIKEYERLLLTTSFSETSPPELSEPAFQSQDGLILTAVEVVSPIQSSAKALASHLPAKVMISYRAVLPQQIGRIDIRVIRDDSTLCSASDSSRMTDASSELHRLSGSGVIEATYDPLQLATGRYFVIVRITDSSDSIVLASGQSQPFHVYAADSVPEPGVFIPRMSWAKHTWGV
jgi:lipopolysaccharide transport system ATP-binding protein